jgi:hypothetical protein
MLPIKWVQPPCINIEAKNGRTNSGQPNSRPTAEWVYLTGIKPQARTKLSSSDLRLNSKRKTQALAIIRRTVRTGQRRDGTSSFRGNITDVVDRS